MSKSSSLPAQPLELFEQTADGSTAAWKQEVNQRLAAHRNRRGNTQSAESQAPAPKVSSARAAEAAARVAARYAQAPSYNEFMAGEARAVVRAAATAAEAAAYSAQVAAQAVLAGLEHPAFESNFENMAHHASEEYWPSESAAPVSPARWQDEPPTAAVTLADARLPAHLRGPAQARWREDLPPSRDDWSQLRVHPTPPPQDFAPDHGHHDPLVHAVVEPDTPIAANLIEFPREITAPRKARPRQDEGPVYDQSQLNIFEVDPGLLSPPLAMHRVAADNVAPPEWASIQLDHAQPTNLHPAQPSGQSQVSYTQHSYVEDASRDGYETPAATVSATPAAPPAPARSNQRPIAAAPVVPNPYNQAYAHAATLPSHAAAAPLHTQPAPSRRTAPLAPPVQPLASAVPATRFAAELLVAPFSDRMLATVVDAALVTLAFLAAAVVAIASVNHMPSGKVALVATACGLTLFSLLYQYLFLSYAEEGTPGMRYARIALCTFSDDNPSREQMRKRIPALLLAAVPAGAGLFWSLIDKDHLGWHDHLTKTYQRKY